MLEEGDGVPDGARLVVSPYHDIPQMDHARLLGAADLALSRTGGQANASAVLALARTPNVVMDLPACGYMQSELTSRVMTHRLSVDEAGLLGAELRPDPLGWQLHWTWDSERIHDTLREALTSREAQEARRSAAHRAFHQLSDSPEGNLFHIAGGLAGL